MKKLCLKKIFILSTLVVVLIGMLCLGIFGLNNSVDYKNAYELDVSVDIENEDTSSIMQEQCKKYFEEVGINPVAYSLIKIGDKSVVYSFHNDISDKIVIEDLISVIKEKAENYMEFDAEIYQTENYVDSQTKNVVLVMAIALVLAFIYLLFMEQIKSALTTLISSLISVLLTISLVSITRVPVEPVFGISVLSSFILSFILSGVLLDRFKEDLRLQEASKLSTCEIVKNQTKNSVVRYIMISVVVLITALVLVVLGTGYLKFLGLQLVLVCVSSLFTSYAWTPMVWKFFNGKKSE